MSLRDNVYMATAELLDYLDKCQDKDIISLSAEVSDYISACQRMTDKFRNISVDKIIPIYLQGNVLEHKLTGAKHVITEDEFVDEFDVYKFVCVEPHGDGDYSYYCEDSNCKCHRR